MTSPQPDPVVNAPSSEVSLDAAEEQYHQAIVAYNKLLEKGMTWLFDVGSWVFGGLIVFTLYIIAALITFEPVDLYIKLATDLAALHASRQRVLRIAARIIPGHGAPFTPGPATPR